MTKRPRKGEKRELKREPEKKKPSRPGDFAAVGTPSAAERFAVRGRRFDVRFRSGS